MIIKYFTKNFAYLAGLISSLALIPAPTLAEGGAAAFAQLGHLLDTPTQTRLASGAPGPAYWQQRADYAIEVRLDDTRQRIEGSETIAYHNRSPHTLSYLWLQLYQNRYAQGSDAYLSETRASFDKLSYKRMATMLEPPLGRSAMPDYAQSLFRQLLVPQLDEHGQPVDVHAEAMQALGLDRMMNLGETNPDMLGLLDVLTEAYSGRRGGIAVLMPDLMLELEPEAAAILSANDGNETSEQRLQRFYRAALERHKENNHTVAAFNTDLFILLNTVMALPYGGGEYRPAFRQAFAAVARAAATESNPDKAAAVFAGRLSEGAAEARARPGGLPGYYRYAMSGASYRPEMVTIRPGLENLQLEVGDRTFDGNDIFQVYNDWQLVEARPEYQASGAGNPLLMHGYFVFKDDDGQRYVMAIDKNTMVFAVEKINVDELKRIEAKAYEEGWSQDMSQTQFREFREDVYERMRQADPGFNLIHSRDPSARLHPHSLPNLYRILKSDKNVPFLHEFAASYAEEAGEIRNRLAAPDAHY